jgi:hypothetical protein
VILIIISAILSFRIFYSVRGALGDGMLRDMRDQYKDVSHKIAAHLISPDAPEVAYAVAIFGAECLAGTVYAQAAKAFAPERKNVWSGWSSSYSGCSGCGG